MSHHAWGVALDLGYGDNPTGTESVQDPRLIEVFARWGFTSGADWLVPDAAHFEFLRPPAAGAQRPSASGVRPGQPRGTWLPGRR